MTHQETLSFRCVLVTGGAGGLGKAMATSLVAKGKTVILAGRTEQTLQSTAKEIGAAASYILDTSDTKAIPGFVKRILADHPELDAIINNAGVQRPFRFPGTEKPGTDHYDFDLAKADAEIDTNIRGPMHLIVSLLPHFQQLASEGKPVCIMNVSSLLGFVPFSIINPVYNGTKAWLHFFTMALRTQLSSADNGKHSAFKVVEIVPPSVETDLHRERTDPDDNKRSRGNKVSMTIPEFMNEVEEGWRRGDDTIAPGPSRDAVRKWYDAYGDQYDKATKG